LLGDVRAFRLRTHLVGIARAVALAERVPAGDEGNGLLVVHAHPPNVSRMSRAEAAGVGIAARAFRIDVDEAHLHRRQRILEHTLLIGFLGIEAAVAQPLFLGAPVDVLLRFPRVRAAAAEAEHRPAHRFDGDVAGHDHQVRPAELASIFLLDRPQEAPRLVEIGVVGPAVQRREALAARGCAAAAVAGAIGAGAVPGHADEEGSVMPVIGRPPGLAVGHQRMKVALHRLIVERLEFRGIIEILAHRVGRADALLMEDVQRKLVRPPIPVGAAQERPQGGRFLHRAAQGAAACLCIHVDHPRVRIVETGCALASVTGSDKFRSVEVAISIRSGGAASAPAGA
jgi:hypothetical protein